MLEGFVPYPESFVKKYRQKNYWVDKTLGEEFDESVRKYGDRVALSCKGERVTYRQLGESVNRLALHFVNLGLKTYDRMIFQLPNELEFVYCFLASAKIGVIPIASLPAHQDAEISFFVQFTKARAHAIPSQFKRFSHQELSRRVRTKEPSLQFTFVSGENVDSDFISITQLLKDTPGRIQAPHQQRTVERMAQHPRVLAVQDTTFLNYTHHPKTEGLGPIGKKSQKQCGLGLHSTLAVLPNGLPLGLLTQAFLIRPEDEPSHRPEECRLLPIEEKESYRWLQAFEQTLALAPRGVEVITVCDREADIYEMFAFAHEQPAPLLVRASSDRVLLDKEVGKLWPKVESRYLRSLSILRIIPLSRSCTAAAGSSIALTSQARSTR